MKASKLISTLLYTVSGESGEYRDITFTNGSIIYFDVPIKQTFSNILLDNIGLGSIRFSFRPGLDLTSPVIGGKTLQSKDSITIQDYIEFLRIYFISTSTIEIIALDDIKNIE